MNLKRHAHDGLLERYKRPVSTGWDPLAYATVPQDRLLPVGSDQVALKRALLCYAS
jgi:hypothetical protein